MSKTEEYLKLQESKAYSHKQAIWKAYTEVRDQTDVAYEEMQAALERRRVTEDELNRRFSTMLAERRKLYEVWDRCLCLCDSNEPCAKKSIEKASNKDSEISDSDAIHASRTRSRKNSHDFMSKEAKKTRRNKRQAKQRARDITLRLGGAEFYAAKAVFYQAKFRYYAAVKRYEDLKDKRDQLKAAYDAAHKEHVENKAKLQAERAKTRSRRGRRSPKT